VFKKRVTRAEIVVIFKLVADKIMYRSPGENEYNPTCTADVHKGITRLPDRTSGKVTIANRKVTAVEKRTYTLPIADLEEDREYVYISNFGFEQLDELEITE